MKYRLLCLLTMLLQAQASSASEAVTFSTERSMVIRLEGKPIAKYVWSDDEISRPYFSDIRTIEGQQVTRRHPPDTETDVADHPTFHPGIWLTFGDLGGSDYWRLKAPTKYVEDSLQHSSDDQTAGFQAAFQYMKGDDSGNVICDEQFHCNIVPADNGYFLLWDSVFSAPQPFWFGDQEEMGLGLRVATPLRAERKPRGSIPPGTGTILDAEGRKNGSEVWGNSAPWCDYSGKTDGQKVGIMLMCHPENFRPSWFHARDYGLLVANPFGRAAFRKGDKSRIDVQPGETLRLRYGLFVHSSPDSAELDLTAAYQAYLKLTVADTE